MTDRTKEFARISKVFEDSLKANASSPSTMAAASAHKPLSQYSRMAEKILDSLTSNEKLVAELTQLVNRKSMLNDPTMEISEITTIFKRDLGILNQDLESFQSMYSHTNRQQSEHFKVVHDSMRSRLAKCAKKFQEALHVRTNVLKEQSSRRSKFSHAGQSPMLQINSPLFVRGPAVAAPGTSNSPANNRKAPANNTALQGNHQPPFPGQPPAATTGRPPFPGDPGRLRRRAAAPLPGGGGGMYESVPQTPGPHMQQQMQYHQPSSSSYAQSRLNAASQVESLVAEMSSMYSRMVNLVAEQGEIVTRIDDDMELAQMNIEGGQNELLKYFKTMSGNRSLIIKIFLILLLIIFLFVVVF